MVENGQSDGWSYRKWDDGTAECWCITSYRSAIASSFGQFNISEKQVSKAYPFTFAAPPAVTASALSETYSLLVVLTGHNDMYASTPNVHAARPAGEYLSEAIDIKVVFHALGRWK